jgi:hypothetical protein
MGATHDELPADYGRNPDRPWERRRGGSGRPWTVTVAALIAFLFVAISAIVVFFSVMALMQWNPAVAQKQHLSHAYVYQALVANVVLGALVLWGAIAAWQGMTGKSLFIGAVVVAAFHIVTAIVASVPRPVTLSVHVIACVLVMALLVTRSSRAYFRT